MDSTATILAAGEKSSARGFCEQECQALLIDGALWMSAIVGFVSLGLVANLIRRNLKSYIVPEIQEKIMVFLMYLPVLITINCLNTYLGREDTPTMLEVLRRLFQMWAYYSFWKMTQNYIEEERVRDILQRKMFGYHLPPFKYCIRPYKFLTEENYIKSTKRIRFFVLQAIGFQAFAMICDVLHDYELIYNPNSNIDDARSQLENKQRAFNFFYILIEAVSISFGSYYIVLYNKMLQEEYKYTNWGWKFVIFVIIMLVSNWQWVFLQTRQTTLGFTQTENRQDHLLVSLNCILLAPEILLATVLALHAFNPAEFEDETRMGFRGKGEISFSTPSRSSAGKSYENIGLATVDTL